MSSCTCNVVLIKDNVLKLGHKYVQTHSNLFACMYMLTVIGFIDTIDGDFIII